MMLSALTSWGRYPAFPQQGYPVYWRNDVPALFAKMPGEAGLAYGCGRSYGDSCMAASGNVLVMSAMNRLVSADWSTGVLVAEAGLTLGDLIRLVVPHGWFPCVVPGTKYVTLGGAVANDVHGKNHHVSGTFGCHVRSLTIHRSDEGIVSASRTERPDLFAATVGGLGLTGIILTVELQLRPIGSSDIEQRSMRFRNLDEFFELSAASELQHEFTVAWIDCVASGRKAGRGIYVTGEQAVEGGLRVGKSEALPFPFDPAVSLVNSFTLPILNSAYYHRQLRSLVKSRVRYETYFFPLDGISKWNRIYGRAGFQQYQCVVPQAQARDVIRVALQEISRSGTGSFIAVLKQCGSVRSPGLMSFPLHGLSLALDFPQRTELNRRLFERLDALVHEAGGRLYPAKDAHMSAAHFQQAYPQWQRVEQARDPRLLSRFWQRVTQ